ncbi:MAG: TlpA family protein disulfide reductase [Proteocatella sp.]
MKKVVVLFILVLSIVILSGCQQNSGNDSKDEVSKADFWGEIESVVDFELKDMDDNLVSNSIFEEKEYTLVNIWGTFCGPCVEEIPILQEIYEENKNINVLGIVADGDINEVKAFEMLNELGANYTNLITNEDFNEEFLSKSQVLPVSIIVDKQGKILETIVGDRTKDEYLDILKKYVG